MVAILLPYIFWIEWIYILFGWIYYFIGELENSGLVNIREQINRLTTDLNVTRKGLEVFSGERKTILPSNTEITFGNELKKKIKKLKVIFFREHFIDYV